MCHVIVSCKYPYCLIEQIWTNYFFSIVLNVEVIRSIEKCYFMNSRGLSKTAATSKMGHFVIIVNGFKLHLGCCSSPTSASDFYKILKVILHRLSVLHWNCRANQNLNNLVKLMHNFQGFFLPVTLFNLNMFLPFMLWILNMYLLLLNK